VLGVVLAPLLEVSLRQSRAMSGGSYVIFVQRPITASLLLVGLVLLGRPHAFTHSP
jgi:putative tricarboxylic transport membrane protein